MIDSKQYELTIITVCFNAFQVLPKTIESVQRQNYRESIEYIIIDGNSNDDTSQVLNDYKGDIDQLIVESDDGIYDAMNKGLDKANGAYVLFLNAGDYLASNTLMEQLHDVVTPPDIFYSDTILVNSRDEKLGLRSLLTTRSLPTDGLTKKDFLNGLVVSHQSIIIKRSITAQYIKDNLSADIDWVIKCVSSALSTYYLSQPISCFLVGGISDQQKFRSLRDRFRIMVNHYGLFRTLIQHFYFVFRYFLRAPELK